MTSNQNQGSSNPRSGSSEQKSEAGRQSYKNDDVKSSGSKPSSTGGSSSDKR